MESAVLGMAHRGRLNVLINIVGKGYGELFKEFEGNIDPDSTQGSGDVKYHKGFTGKFTGLSGKTIDVYLSSNPSHLEAVDPVVEGMARARLDLIDHGDESPVLAMLVHGDAAFAGQGVVAETLNMSSLRGYAVGGTVHLVINNQLGFTTNPESARSSVYATDVAKMVQAPIFHVNGDDPEACTRVGRLAFAFRQAFHKDVVIDMVCYRRFGHNEQDDPSLTQPRMYELIKKHRSVRKLYTETLVRRGDITMDRGRGRPEGLLPAVAGRARRDAGVGASPPGRPSSAAGAGRGPPPGGDGRGLRDPPAGRHVPAPRAGRLHGASQARQGVRHPVQAVERRRSRLGARRGVGLRHPAARRPRRPACRVRTPGGARSGTATRPWSTTTPATSTSPSSTSVSARPDSWSTTRC